MADSLSYLLSSGSHVYDADTNAALDLRFEATTENVQGILGMAQEWAVVHGIGRVDQGTLRLVLEELLLNICFYAYPPGSKNTQPHTVSQTGMAKLFIGLRPPFQESSDPKESGEPGDPGGRQGEERDGSGSLRQWAVLGGRQLFLEIQDAGLSFNPLAQAPRSVGASPSDTPLGGKGLSFVNLLAVQAAYTRAEGVNILSLALPLSETPSDDTHEGVPHVEQPTAPQAWHFGLLRSSLALKQTLFLGVTAWILLWVGMFLFHQAVSGERREVARSLGDQVMHSLSLAGERLFDSLAADVQGIAYTISKGSGRTDAANGAPVSEVAEQEQVRALLAGIAVHGAVYADDSGAREWLLVSQNGTLRQTLLPYTFTPVWSRSARSARLPLWQGPVMDMPEHTLGDNAPMFLGIPWHNGQEGGPRDHTVKRHSGLLGGLVDTTRVAQTLEALSGFPGSRLFMLNQYGEYIIFPPGRSRHAGPANIFADARVSHEPLLAELGRAMLRREGGSMRFEEHSPWTVSWQGPVTVLYRPLRSKEYVPEYDSGTPSGRTPVPPPDVYLGLVVSSEALGEIPPPFPESMVILALFGPLGFGLLIWRVTSWTLQPVKTLSDSLERMAEGDLDSPLPVPVRPDETGNMLRSFERARLTLRAALHILIANTTAQERLNNELAVARTIQESMLSTEFPALPGVEVHAHIDMAREVCGDLYDCFTLSAPDMPERVCYVVADVSGKGIPAAMLMSSAMSLARAALLEGLEPAAVLARVNTALIRNNTASMFVTMLVGILDPQNGAFTWASAGHPPPMLARALPKERHQEANDGRVEVEKSHSAAVTVEHEGDEVLIFPWPGELALGIRANRQYSDFFHTLDPGEILLLYTDGATEAVSPPAGGGIGRTGSGLFFGEEPLAESLARNRGASDAASLLKNIRADIFTHMAGLAPHDDITLMVIRRTL